MSNSLDTYLPYQLQNVDDPSLLPNLKEINESAETKAECLEKLRRELQNLEDIEPCLEDDFLLRFLRLSKFNISNAFHRILKYYQQQDILQNALKKTSLPLQKARKVNHIWISPYRLRNNSALLFGLGGKVDYSKITFSERFALEIMAANAELGNPVNQIAGITAIFDFQGFNFRSFLQHTPSSALLFIETFMNAFPARIKEVHVVNAPSLFLTVFKLMYPFLSKKIQGRVFMHSKDWKNLHAHIPPEILPEEYGGQLQFNSCINALENIEELEDNFNKMFEYGYIRTKTSRMSFRPICRKN